MDFDGLLETAHAQTGNRVATFLSAPVPVPPRGRIPGHSEPDPGRLDPIRSPRIMGERDGGGRRRRIHLLRGAAQGKNILDFPSISDRPGFPRSRMNYRGVPEILGSRMRLFPPTSTNSANTLPRAQTEIPHARPVREITAEPDETSRPSSAADSPNRAMKMLISATLRCCALPHPIEAAARTVASRYSRNQITEVAFAFRRNRNPHQGM